MFTRISAVLGNRSLNLQIAATVTSLILLASTFLTLAVSSSTLSIPLIILALVFPTALLPWMAYHAKDSARQLETANTTIEGIARMDSTTGLLNRQGFIEKGCVAFLKARSEGAPLSAIVIDVDHLKDINHQHGFGAGDAALAYVAQLLTLNLQSGADLASRYGGAEFVLFLPQADYAWASAFAERLRGSLDNRPIQYDGKLIKISASFGVASILPTDAAPEMLVARASRALETAKSGGRNKVEVAAEQMEMAA